MNNFGFIITRHVNSEKTNRYWNHSVKLLRTFYPDKKIVITEVIACKKNTLHTMNVLTVLWPK